jgi:hypothetical protein
MLILVERDNETIFKGEADDFLYENDNDLDLETALNDLEEEKVGTVIKVYNSDGDEISITKGVTCIY